LYKLLVITEGDSEKLTLTWCMVNVPNIIKQQHAKRLRESHMSWFFSMAAR